MNRNHLPVHAGAAGLLLGLLACRPVIAVGLGELFILVLLMAFLLGPFLFKLARAWNKHQESKQKK